MTESMERHCRLLLSVDPSSRLADHVMAGSHGHGARNAVSALLTLSWPNMIVYTGSRFDSV